MPPPSHVEAICQHMNDDHQLALADMVWYHTDGVDVVDTVRMTDIELDAMTVEYTTTTAKPTPVLRLQLPLNPAMNTLGEARKTLVAMAHDAARARGVSVRQLREYHPPRGADQLAVWGVVSWCLLLAVNPQWAVDLPVVRHVLPPVVHDFLVKYHWLAVTLVFAIHCGEYFVVFRPLLDYYRVPQPARAIWILSFAFEGYPAVQRVRQHGGGNHDDHDKKAK